MTRTVKRTYNSSQRTRQAALTRERILGAAQMLFSTAGYGATTIDAVAKAAEVSTATVYATFGNKRALVDALAASVLRDEDTGALFAQVAPPTDAASAEAQIRLHARISVHICERHWDVFVLMRSAAAVDPDAAQAWKDADRSRLDSLRPIAAGLARAGLLHRSVDEAGALDVLWGFTGPILYDTFVVGRGWTPAAFERWLADTLLKLLLPTP